jgi:tetrahydromethanopterin S-methyltransferase subunit D
MTSAVEYVFNNTREQVGIMAWYSLCIIAISSTNVVRRLWFEGFYYTHFVFIAFTIGGVIHASHGPEFLLPGFIL